jgi:hypothetical protein
MKDEGGKRGSSFTAFILHPSSFSTSSPSSPHRPPADKNRNAASTKNSENRTAPSVILAWRLDDADAVAIDARYFNHPGDTGHFNLDYSFAIDCASPLNQLRTDLFFDLIIKIIAAPVAVTSPPWRGC